jgi:hypothetical protein
MGGGITQLWLCPYPQEKRTQKKNLFKLISFQKQFLQTLQTCAQRKSAQSTERYIYIYIYIVANFTTKWDFSSKFFFVFSVGITPTVINLSVKTLSLSLSIYLSIYLSIHLSSSLSLSLSLWSVSVSVSATAKILRTVS